MVGLGFVGNVGAAGFLGLGGEGTTGFVGFGVVGNCGNEFVGTAGKCIAGQFPDPPGPSPLSHGLYAAITLPSTTMNCGNAKPVDS